MAVDFTTPREDRMYPSVYDYADAASVAGKTVVDEIRKESSIVHDAAVGTTSGFKFDFDREVERKYSAHPVSMDEGYVAGSDVRHQTVSCDTMRVNDARTFDQLIRNNQPADDAARVALASQAMSQGIIREKARNIVYGGMPDTKGEVNAKEIPGLIHYVNVISNKQEMYTRWEEGLKSPFRSENGFTLANEDGASSTAAAAISGAKGKRAFTSVLGIGWGIDGCFTTYPTGPKTGSMGYLLQAKIDVPAGYKDKYDELNKMAWEDWMIGDAYFGVGVKNRFNITGLRNIYLGHSKKDDLMDEMYRVQQNLIEMYRFHNMGETGIPMIYYCSPFLLDKMQTYLNGGVQNFQTRPGENNGSYGPIATNTLQIADGIILVADPAIRITESFISEKEA